MVLSAVLHSEGHLWNFDKMSCCFQETCLKSPLCRSRKQIQTRKGNTYKKLQYVYFKLCLIYFHDWTNGCPQFVIRTPEGCVASDRWPRSLSPFSRENQRMQIFWFFTISSKLHKQLRKQLHVRPRHVLSMLCALTISASRGCCLVSEERGSADVDCSLYFTTTHITCTAGL